jgi:hypothetical protein
MKGIPATRILHGAIHWGAFHASEIRYIWETLPDLVYGTQASFLVAHENPD